MGVWQTQVRRKENLSISSSGLRRRLNGHLLILRIRLCPASLRVTPQLFQVGGTGTYRLTVDAHGAVTQVTILKGFTVAAVYDERFSNVKGNAVPALDKVMVQALMRWRAKPGQSRVVDIYWSFGTRPWVNYGKSNVSE